MTLVNVPLHPHKIKAATATKIDSYKCFKICTLMLSGNCDFLFIYWMVFYLLQLCARSYVLVKST